MGDKVEMKELEYSAQDQLMDLFRGRHNFARFGDVGCLLPLSYKEDADRYKNMVIRSDDVFVATFPRSGTTWTGDLVWLLMNNLDYDTALKVPYTDRCVFLETKHIGPVFIPLESTDPEALKTCTEIFCIPDTIPDMTPPRCIKTHLPISLLPTNMLETAKVVYVARDPRDVAVSFYQLCKLLMNYSGDFKTYWNLFINDLVIYTPFFPRLKEAWALRDHPNMLFMFYEEGIRDFPSSIKRVAHFLSKELTNEETMKLCEHLDINNFKKNESVNPSWYKKAGNPNADGFVRKGKSGGWRDHFDEEMTAQAQNWMSKNLADTDLRFPDAASK